jgi:hypothetical protein
MISKRTKRLVVVLLSLPVVLVIVAGIYGYLLSRDPGFDMESPNAVDARECRRKLKLYGNSVTNGHIGFVRLSQLEINSYIREALTNSVGDTNASGLHLKRLGVGLTTTNFTVYSWGEYKVMNFAAPLVVQRTYKITQQGTNQWQLPLESLKIGHVEISERIWDKVLPCLEPLDSAALDRFSWTTNILALLTAKNELSQRPELRLYTYKPIPAEDLR